MWRDEKRRPGPFPQSRYAPLLILLAFVAVALVRPLRGAPLAILVIIIGLGSFYAAARMDRARLEDERYARGPGWWLGLLISKTSVGFARAFYVLLGVGICALGAVVLAAHV
jgi:hypothetical protein